LDRDNLIAVVSRPGPFHFPGMSLPTHAGSIALFYARMTRVKPEAFLAAANSFGVDVRMRAADAQVTAMRVPSTPCIVVNGKYRLNMDSLRSGDELIDLVKYLVAKESTH
jgi:thiol:disulfide interchange protein DsbA